MEHRVLGIAEARNGLSALVDGMTTDPNDVAILGSHRKPEAALLPYSTYLKLKDGIGVPATVGLEFVRSRGDLVRRIGAMWGMQDIAVFGSVARGEEGPDSDIDLLVDAESGRSLFDIAGFESDLEQLFGRPVDVIIRSALNPTRRRDRAMLDEAIRL